MEEALHCPPTSKLSFEGQIYNVQLSPYEWSQNLICIAFSEEIAIGTVKFHDEDETLEEVVYTPIKTFHHDTRVHAISWSPETSLSVVPKVLAFCVAGADFKIRLYNSDLNDLNKLEIIGEHRDYINDISYESEGELLASVSDDHSCKLWAIKDEQKCLSTFHLTSPGMSVCWHNEESGKLLVAEKNGLIHMYNIRSHQAIMSLDAGIVPLSSADWSPNSLNVACLAAGELILWDVSRPSRPLDSRTLYVEGGIVLKFLSSNEYLIATIGRPDNILKITNLRTKQVVLSADLQLYGGLSWHYKLPYVCAGNDREVHFWRKKSK